MDPGKKNIVILIGQLVFGGAEKQSLLLAKALAEHYDVHYVVMKPFKVAESYLHFLRESGTRYEILDGNIIKRLVKMVRLLRAFQAHLLFCYLPGDNIAGTLAGKLAGVPYIIGGIRNTKIVRSKFYLLRFVQNTFQDRVIFNSSRAMEIFCSKGYRKDKSLVIENAFEEQVDFFARPESDIVRILMVGRFVRQKDYLTGIRAVASLPEMVAGKKIKLTIAGYGALEAEVRDWIRTHGLQELTEVHIQPDNLPELFQKSDIYLNSSIHEGFSNAVMEAMAHGLPVVATQTGDIEKQVMHGRSGYIAPVGDYEKLGKWLATLCRDHHSRVSFGKEGHQKLYTSYGLEPFRKKYVKLIQALE